MSEKERGKKKISNESEKIVVKDEGESGFVQRVLKTRCHYPSSESMKVDC